MEKRRSAEPKEEGTVEEEAGTSKRKRSSQTPKSVEPRTPLKRHRMPVQKFQSPAEEFIPTPSTSKAHKDEVELLHKKGAFLGVRGDEETFYLCKTAQNVFANTRKFKIQWLDIEELPDVYKIDFIDTTDADCILTNVRMGRVARDTYRLPDKERTRVQAILDKALAKERGEPIDDIVIADDNDDDDDDDDAMIVDTDNDEDDEPSPAKKVKKEKPKSHTKPRKSATVKVKSKDSKTKKDKKSKKDKKKKEKGERKKGPDRNLKPNPKIKVLEKDPFFETKQTCDFISKVVQGKLAIRAVTMKNMGLLKSLMEDKEHIYELDIPRSIDVEKNALHYALEQNDHEAIKLLMLDFHAKENKRKKEGCPQNVLLASSDTGTYNPLSLGIRNIRAISQSRGSREGNDAFTKDGPTEQEAGDYAEDALKLGVTKETFEVLISSCSDAERAEMLERGQCNLYQAVLCGNRKLAGYLVEETMKDCANGFGYLHKDVLLFDKEELRPTILAASVKKKPWNNKSITPMHCAAINPNVAYLTRLLSVEPNVNLEDKEHRRPIHFAAVCEGVAPLEFLLQRGASPMECDNQGMTPLHYACSAGRPRNVDCLLKKSKDASAKQGDVFAAKWGPGGVDRPSRSSYCPIHMAIIRGHTDVLKILIKHQVDVKKAVSAGKNRLTPLIMATGYGHLEMVKILIQNGATVEQPDKLKRTALTHAVMNGNTVVASYLLALGADPNRADSSGNTVVHYAAAYGWQFCLKLLVDAGADASQPNHWMTTPASIAFLKGHGGLVDYLLRQPGVDINFKNDAGRTLASVAAGSSLQPGLYDQMRYLIDDKKADPRIADVKGLDTLHHLASNNVVKKSTQELASWNRQWERREQDEDKMELTVKIATLLLEAGCDATNKTADGRTALMMAVQQVNGRLVKLLVDRGGIVTSHKSDTGQTILHKMAAECLETDFSPLLKILVEQKHKPKASKQKEEDESGKPGGQVNNIGHAVNNVDDSSDDAGEGKLTMDIDDDSKDTKDDGTGDSAAVKPKENGSAGSGDEEMKNDLDAGDPAPPHLEKYTDEEMVDVEESQEDIWPVMAAEVDEDGFTPLLLACKMYRDFKVQGGMKGCDVVTCSENGRNFIEGLIELTSADVSSTVAEKSFEGVAPPQERDRYIKEGKCSPLHLLVHVGHEGHGLSCLGLPLLLQHRPNLEHRNLDGHTALIMAVEGNMEKAAAMMVKAGADVNTSYMKDTHEVTPLLVAAKDGHSAIIRLLLDAKANVKVLNSTTNESPLHLAVQYRGNEANIVEIAGMLLAAGADINNGGTTPLHSAVLANLGSANSSTQLEEFMFARGANIYAHAQDKGRLPLHYAFISKSEPSSTSPLDPIELCSVLTDAMRDRELDTPDEDGRTPLHLASIRGATICCVHLLQRGVSIKSKDNDGNTAFSLAVKYKHDSCAIMLLQRGASVEDSIMLPAPKIPDWRQYYKKTIPIWSWKPARIEGRAEKKKFTVYQGAIYSELQGVAHMVLDLAGLNGKAVEAALHVSKYHIVMRHLSRIKDPKLISGYTNNEEQNLLHILALHSTPGSEPSLQLKVAQMLVDKGVSLSQLDKYGRTPLMYAAFKHQPCDLGEFFIGKETNLERTDIYGRTAMVAFFWDHDQIYNEQDDKDNTKWIEMLKKAGASLDVLYEMPVPKEPLFDVTITENTPDFFSTLDNCSTLTPLISTIYHSDFGLMKFLLKSGASPNMPDRDGVTPLMHAVKVNDKLLVKLLLNHEFVDADHEDQEKKHMGLKRQLSRHIFAIKPTNPTPELLSDDEEGAGDDDGGDDDEQDDDDGDHDTDDDHDTDVVSDDDEDDHEAETLPIPRLGSKQPSMKKMLSSITSKTDEFPLVEKTSSVELDETDHQGWTAIHHLVSPLEHSTYDNEEILYVLAKVGADLTVEDKSGLTPLARALASGAVRLADRLQKLTEVTPGSEEKPEFMPFRSADPWDSELDKSEVGTYVGYADSMLKLLEVVAAGKDEKAGIVKPKPDSHCMVAHSGEVMSDQQMQLPYDVILSKIDVRSLLYDVYNFYKMQIIWHKAKDIYILFTRWGRIGTSGQYQHTPYQKLSEAVTEFCKIFRSKTGNTWANVKNFQIEPKKYRLVELDKHKTVVKVTFDLESSRPSKLPTQVQDVLKEMADVGMMVASMHKAKMAESYMPFGKIKREHLLAARKLLQKIGDIVLNIEKNKRNTIAFDSAKHQKNCEQIVELSTEYYNLVPQEGYAYDRVPPLSEKHDIKANIRLISNLLDLECASKILLAAQYRSSEINPLDYIYQSVGCSVQPLREDDVESQYILKYIRSSSSCHVLGIYKLWRQGEQEKMDKLKLDNHKLLWHGSSVNNMMSILHNGLLVAPPEAPITGHAFGEGIYTADTFIKSQGYCHNHNPKSELKLALLCEVALGNYKEDVDASIEVDLVNAEYNSLLIHGHTVPNREWNVAMPYGASMPLGCVNNSTWKMPDGRLPHVGHNEYIVQNSDQICLRYLVHFKG